MTPDTIISEQETLFNGVSLYCNFLVPQRRSNLAGRMLLSGQCCGVPGQNPDPMSFRSQVDALPNGLDFLINDWSLPAYSGALHWISHLKISSFWPSALPNPNFSKPDKLREFQSRTLSCPMSFCKVGASLHTECCGKRVSSFISYTDQILVTASDVQEITHCTSITAVGW